jgi:hypothetical protein
MKKDKGFAPIIIVLIVIAILALGGIYYFLSNKTPEPVVCTQEAKLCPDGSYVSRTGPNCEFTECPEVVPKDVYYFKSVGEGNLGMQQHLDYSVEIYKNQQLIKKINIKDTMVEPTLFVLSPDQKYVAFKTAGYGGTCVYLAFPTVIDLNNFSIVDLDDSDINKKLENALGVNPSDPKINFSAVEEIKDIKWTSNDKIEVTMKFGEENGCSILVYPKPADFPESIELKVDYTMAPYIKVISPNGGGQWMIGESYDIEWASRGIENVNILLTDYRAPETCYLNATEKEDLICEGAELPYSCKPRPIDATGGSFHIDNLSQVICQPGMHQWPVIDISSGDQYKIKIEDADNPSIADFSDNYFNITE